MSWRRWGNPIVDCGRELEVARQLADGALLYGDVRYYYGPLAPYLDAALFRFFGVHADVLMAAGAVSAALMCGLLYTIGRRLAGPVAGTVAAVAFLYLGAFAHLYVNGIFNWVLPYNYSATYGMLAATACLWALVRWVEEERARDLWLAAAGLALAATAKLEPLVPAAVAWLVLLAADAARGRLRLRTHAVPLGTALLGVAAVYGVFALAVGPIRLGQNLLGVANARARTYVLSNMGLIDWAPNLALMAESAAALGVLLALAALVVRVARPHAESGTVRWLVLPSCFALPTVLYWTLSWDIPFRVLPALALAAPWVALGLWRRRPAERGRATTRLLLWSFALGCLARMPLSASALHYGFYLLPVPLLALVVLWFEDVPGWLPGPAPLARRVAGAVGLGMFAGIVAVHFAQSRRWYAERTALLETPRGALYLIAQVGGFPIGQVQIDVVRALAARPPGTRVLVLPQGVGFTFLAGLTSAGGMHSFLPVEFGDAASDAELVGRLEQAPPEVVLWVPSDLREYGSAGFGVDYAQQTAAWLNAHYTAVAQFGGGAVVLFEPIARGGGRVPPA